MSALMPAIRHTLMVTTPPLTVGVDFAVAQDRLPAGWASVTLFDVRGEFAAVYSGPVLEETTETITLEVFEERMKPMVKRDCTIVRAVTS
jgi:hypothetical protein